MTSKRIFFSVLFSSLLMISSAVKAQFEGQISIDLISQEDNGQTEISKVNLYTTKERIIVKGEDAISVMEGSFNAQGLLIRNDKKDFIVLMGEDKALQFTKTELEGFFQMMAMMSGGDKDVNVKTDFDTDFTYTSETRTILGYECTELEVTNKENDNTMSIWLTAGIDIDWGMLAEPWKNVPKDVKGSADRLTQEFKSQNFPMLIEVTEEGNTETVFQVTNVNRSSVGKAMVEIPTGVKLMGLTEFIFSSGMNGF